MSIWASVWDGEDLRCQPASYDPDGPLTGWADVATTTFHDSIRVIVNDGEGGDAVAQFGLPDAERLLARLTTAINEVKNRS